MTPNQIMEFVKATYSESGKVNIQPYAYRVPFANLTAGQTQTSVLNANANSDFILLSARYRAAISDVLENVNPLVRVLLTDTGSSVQLSDQQVDISTMFANYGESGNPDFVYPRIIAGRSALQVQVSNYSPALIYRTLELTFMGVLVQGYN